MQEHEILKLANEIANPHGLTAGFLAGEDALSVGVGGDHRTCTRIIVLVGPFPGHEILANISTKISNVTNINRVTFDITPPVQKNP